MLSKKELERRNNKGLRKGMVILFRYFDKSIDGPYYDKSHRMNEKLDERYVHTRLKHFMILKCHSSDFEDFYEDMGDQYVVYVYVKKGTKKYEALKEFGFIYEIKRN